MIGSERASKIDETTRKFFMSSEQAKIPAIAADAVLVKSEKLDDDHPTIQG